MAANMTNFPFSAKISDQNFQQIQAWMKQWAGVTLGDNKRALVCSRLNSRLRELDINDYAAYIRFLDAGRNKAERQQLVDALTTNETYFFREPNHFEFLRDWLMKNAKAERQTKVWCAAASSGEEPYSLAMTLDDVLGRKPWKLVASDINQRVLNTAKRACYDANHRGEIARHFLHRYFLRGVRSQAGKIMVAPELQRRVNFQKINLNEALPFREPFDVVFIRNVLIYFDSETKAAIIERILPFVRDGGCIVVSHSETLNGISTKLRPMQPSIYIKQAVSCSSHAGKQNRLAESA